MNPYIVRPITVAEMAAFVAQHHKRYAKALLRG
jgi:hypothetical protein